MKITPILYVDAIEPCLDFWVGKLGMTKTVEVPDGDKLGFVILNHESVELMIQTRHSVANDMPALLGEIRSALLFIEVPDFNELLKQVEGLQVLVPVRDTFYGMREIVVRDPGGNVVCFAWPIKT
jgi:catechol 2,3-dioxygenase-like lactoylglutathione lyase family enzyme